jgi:acyl-CoA synthetase (AMP-forming)/AMP-acid ligase II
MLLHDLLPGRDHLGGRDAIVHGECSRTYRDLTRAVEALAGRLAASGLARGDRVAIYLPKSFDECVAIFAASRASAVFVPVNSSLKPAQVRHIVADCGARVLLSSAAMLSKLDGALDDLADLQILLCDDDGSDKVAAAPPATAIGGPRGDPLHPGSTYRPKGVMLSHRNLLAGTRIVRTYLGIGPEERILSILLQLRLRPEPVADCRQQRVISCSSSSGWRRLVRAVGIAYPGLPACRRFGRC